MMNVMFPLRESIERVCDLTDSKREPRKKEFVGKTALIAMAAKGSRRNLVSLELDSTTTPAHPGDSVIKGGKVVGTVTSAGWGYRIHKNLAYAFVDPDADGDLNILVLGREVPCSIVDRCMYDPENSRVR